MMRRVTILGEIGYGLVGKVMGLRMDEQQALTWNYPAVAVLGLSMADVGIGCYKLKRGRNSRMIRVHYKGIRNLLCNIVRMTCQQNLFD